MPDQHLPNSPIPGRLMVVVWLANIAIIMLGVGVAYVVRVEGTGFALGALSAMALFQIFHRIKYGYWF
ncbi:MAG TPA: hypothetical protein VKA19_02740 [Alphaproteobacteria bacterium]|nr:hypothetical protein [Alphaproteobacteria bacterium]